MFFCLRVDLDYVPWDTPDATEFGHGEPAAFLRLLDLARHSGYRFHFFVSSRVLRAFPATAEAVLNDGHDLDWLCKHPTQAGTRFAEVKELFSGIGHQPHGFCVKGTWPAEVQTFEGVESLKFLSARPGSAPKGVKLFPVEARSVREATRAGLTARTWSDSVKVHLRESASRNHDVTLTVRPQVLAKADPRLTQVQEILDLADAVGLQVKTLRDVMKG